MKEKRRSISRLAGGTIEGVPDILMQSGAPLGACLKALFEFAQINDRDEDGHYRLFLWLASRIFPGFSQPEERPDVPRSRGRPRRERPAYDLATAQKFAQLWLAFRDAKRREADKRGSPFSVTAALVKAFFAKYPDLLAIFQVKDGELPELRTIQRLVKLTRDAERFRQLYFGGAKQPAPAELIQAWGRVERLNMPADTLDYFLRRLFALDLWWGPHQQRFYEIADEAAFVANAFQHATGLPPSLFELASQKIRDN